MPRFRIACDYASDYNKCGCKVNQERYTKQCNLMNRFPHGCHSLSLILLSLTYLILLRSQFQLINYMTKTQTLNIDIIRGIDGDPGNKKTLRSEVFVNF